jgi:Mg-chelatase subunit ChlD
MQPTGMNIIESTLMCPITQEIMKDPVQGSDGQTYDRDAIVTWLNQKQTSPLTNLPMGIHDLKVNAAIKYLVDQYHAGNLSALSGQMPQTSQNNNSQDNKSENNNKILTHNYGILKDKGLLSIFDEYTSIKDNVSKDDLLGIDLVLCIDRSGSMAATVEAKDENGSKLEDGFTQQDIVNHAAKTLAKSLSSKDRLSIVIFDNKIETIFELLPMTPVNVSLFMSKINDIKPGGQTDIWNAIERAYEILGKRSDTTRNSAVMLLTDGIPNVSPARGEIETLKRKKKTSGYESPLYTFGFGYNLQKGLLYEMAKYGNGLTGHIPDGGMIATVFSNFLGNIQSTVATNIKLYIETYNDAVINHIEPIMGEYIVENISDKKYLIYINSLQIEQSRHIIINFDKLPRNKNVICAKYYLEYTIGNKSEKTCEYDYYYNDTTEHELLDTHIIRYKVIENIRKAINLKNSMQNNVDDILKIMDDLTKKYENELLTNINDTINEQVNLALSCKPEHVTNYIPYFKKWGEFYLDQLTLALNNEFKPNFKDKACFSFGGNIFNNFVDNCSDIFDTLPPPEPSVMTINNTVYSYTGSYRGLGNTPPPPPPSRVASLASYNNPSGGCFDSNCLITMSDNSKKMLKNVKKGDEILTLEDRNNINTITYTKVLCVYETFMVHEVCYLVMLENGLKITPWHPILTPLGWKFPSDLKSSQIESCASIITLVLESGHVAFINEHPCITLGHNFKDEVLNHEFYGTKKVIKCLQNMPGYEEGHIKNNSGNIIHDNNGDVINIEYM